MYWSSKELSESNYLLAGWSGFELRSTPLQSKKITGTGYPNASNAMTSCRDLRRIKLLKQ